MSSAFESFATGFLAETTRNINVRKDRADDYFEQQMERARTRGADALAKRKEKLNSLTTVANTLKNQANMPEDVLKMVINEGPDTLAQVEQIYKVAVENGTELDEDFWRGVVDSTTEMKSDNESLGDFLGRTVGLFGGNLAASKTDGEGGDPFSAFVASGLGYNAMDKARAQLDSEEVAEGFTAGELIAMEGRPEFDSPYGSQGVTINATKAVDTLDEQAGVKPLSVTEKLSIAKQFQEKVATAISDAESSKGDDLTPEEEDKIRVQVATEMSALLGEDVAGQIPEISSAIAPAVEDAPASTQQSEYIEGQKYTFNGPNGLFSPTYIGVDGETGFPLFRLEDGTEVPLDVSEGGTENSAEGVTSDEGPDPQAQVIEQAVQPGGNPEDFSIRGDQIPQTLKLNGVQYWFQSIEDKGGKSFAIFVDENGNEQPVPISD